MSNESTPVAHPTGEHKSPGRTTRRTLLVVACWAYLIVLLAAWLTMRFAGDWWWPGTVLLMAPRWPFAVPLLILWPWAVGIRRWHPLAVTTLATWIVFFPIMGVRVSLPVSGLDRTPLRLLSCNIHRKRLDPKRLAEFIADVQPNVIALQDWSEANREPLFGGGEWNVRTVGELLVASLYPIRSVTPIDISNATNVLRGDRGVAAMFELDTPQGLVYLINLHLASPHEGLLTFGNDSGEKLAANIDRRWYESGEILRLASGVQGPLLIAGDFNTTDDSPIFRENFGRFTDAFTRRGVGLGYTYIIGHTQLRIDHILTGPWWQVARCWTGPDVGSPHRPLVADLIRP